MAYGRRRKRTYGRKRKMYKKGGLSRMVSRKVYSALNRNIETKFIDTQFDSGLVGIVSGTYTITRLTVTALGNQDNGGRIGDKIRLHNMQLRMNVVAGDTVNRIRCTIIRWNEDDNFNAPTSSQIYQSPLATVQGYFNMDTLKSGKMNILYDKVIDVEVNDHAQQQYKLFKKLSSFVKYSAGGASGTGHIYFIYTSDSSTLPHPTIEVTSRITYKDA